MGNGASPENFAKLAQLLTNKWSGAKQSTEKTTNQDSDMDENGIIYQELIGTIADPGTLDITANWVPDDTSQQTLLGRFDNQVHNYQVRGPVDLTTSPLTRKFTFRFAASMFESPSFELSVDKTMVLTSKLQLIGESSLTYNDAADSN